MDSSPTSGVALGGKNLCLRESTVGMKVAVKFPVAGVGSSSGLNNCCRLDCLLEKSILSCFMNYQ